MLRRDTRNRGFDFLSIRYRVIQRINWRKKMKKIAAVLLVMVMAGCSSMGMNTSGRSSMGMGASGIDNRNSVIDPNGQLNIYHGG
jgi:hypothetical protein